LIETCWRAEKIFGGIFMQGKVGEQAPGVGNGEKGMMGFWYLFIIFLIIGLFYERLS